jgi:hypothetical protein
MLTINYMDINHTDISFDVGTLDGLISYHDEGNSVIDQARGILDRYQTAYNASYVQDFLNSLDSYSTVTNSSQQIGDFRIDMHSAYGEETITWSRAVNSIPNSRDVIS